MINVDALKRIVGDDYVVTQRDQIQGYLADETYLGVLPKPADNVVVVKPANAEEISAILKLANVEKTPVYPRGGGTGLVGGAVPTRDGIVLSMERLDKVIEVDKDNMMVVAEGGVTLEHLLKAVENADLLFPPHPGDEGAQVGGMIACNAGGTRAVKYGVVRNYVKGLEVVLPTGEIVTMGGKLPTSTSPGPPSRERLNSSSSWLSPTRTSSTACASSCPPSPRRTAPSTSSWPRQPPSRA